jgi:hypothetical protein
VVNVTPRPIYPQEGPGTHCIGGWVGPRVGLTPTGIRSPDRPARSESLYRLSYPGPRHEEEYGNYLDKSLGVAVLVPLSM